MSAPPAHAFLINTHDRITRDALPYVGVPYEVLARIQILLGLPPGAGVIGSDALVGEAFRHIDNAQNPNQICALTQQAWNFFIPLVLSGSRLTALGPVNGPGALAAFGGLMHALQDFFAHSNWVEINVAIGQPERMPPPLTPTCDPAAYPRDLHTGFYSFDFGLQGCPPGGPPPGFTECHSSMNKDEPSAGRGSELLPPGMVASGAVNYFDLAVILATRATRDLYQRVRALVAAENGENAARLLFQAG